MWARQSGWADATPKEAHQSNRERNPDLQYPAVLDESDEILTRLLYVVGPAKSTGFGLTGISWPDLKAWSDLTRIRLAPWQAEILIIMSRGYASEFSAASSEKYTDPPWADEETLEKRAAAVPDILRTGLRSLMKAR